MTAIVRLPDARTLTFICSIYAFDILSFRPKPAMDKFPRGGSYRLADLDILRDAESAKHTSTIRSVTCISPSGMAAWVLVGGERGSGNAAATGKWLELFVCSVPFRSKLSCSRESPKILPKDCQFLRVCRAALLVWRSANMPQCVARRSNCSSTASNAPVHCAPSSTYCSKHVAHDILGMSSPLWSVEHLKRPSPSASYQSDAIVCPS